MKKGRKQGALELDDCSSTNCVVSLDIVPLGSLQIFLSDSRVYPFGKGLSRQSRSRKGNYFEKFAIVPGISFSEKISCRYIYISTLFFCL
jgi:hypothetical protein